MAPLLCESVPPCLQVLSREEVQLSSGYVRLSGALSDPVCVCVCVCTHAACMCMRMCMCMSIYVCMYVCMYLYEVFDQRHFMHQDGRVYHTDHISAWIADKQHFLPTFAELCWYRGRVRIGRKKAEMGLCTLAQVSACSVGKQNKNKNN